MIDLCISGTLEKDAVIFSLNGECKTINQFSKQIHFLVEEKKTYRLHFEQKNEQFIPRHIGIMLNILFLPIRGIINILTFNTIPIWWNDISAFKISGYIDINLTEATEISFELKQGYFDKRTDMFCPPVISFSPNILIEQSCIPDMKEIKKAHHNHLSNIASASILLFALLLYLLYIGAKNELNVACIITLILMILLCILTTWLIWHSFKKRGSLITVLNNQQSKKGD